MKSIRTLFPMLGVVTMLAACSGSETTNTGATANALTPASDTSSVATAGDGARKGWHGRHGGGPDFLVNAALRENLNLTDAQRSTIEGLAHRERGEHEARPAPDKAKLASLAAAVRSGNVDAAKVAAAEPSGGANVFADRRANAAEKLKTLHDTLTKEQRSALVDAIAAKRASRPEAKDHEERGREGRRFEGREQGPGGHMLEGLDLTQAQKDQIKAKLEAERPAPPSEADRSAMKAAMQAKLESFKADTFDANAFVAPPANAPKMNAGEPRAKALSAIVSVLTPAQREKLAQRIEQGPPARR